MSMWIAAVHKDVYIALEKFRSSEMPDLDFTILLNSVLYQFCCNSGYPPKGVFAASHFNRDVKK